jgi:hypothetical protein
MKTIIAIDPGKSGGIAVGIVGPDSGLVTCYPMPATDGDVLALLRDVTAAAVIKNRELVAYIELVCGYTGGAGAPGSAMFNFGMGFGFLKGVVMTLGIRLVLVRPQEWQKSFHLGSASICSKKSDWKRKLKAEAQRLFVGQSVTLKTADALLILDWARRQEVAK